MSFSGYYNGLPEDRDLQFDLDTDHAVIIGLGNVAIDVARVLTTPIDELKVLLITYFILDRLIFLLLKRLFGSLFTRKFMFDIKI